MVKKIGGEISCQIDKELSIGGPENYIFTCDDIMNNSANFKNFIDTIKKKKDAMDVIEYAKEFKQAKLDENNQFITKETLRPQYNTFIEAMIKSIKDHDDEYKQATMLQQSNKRNNTFKIFIFLVVWIKINDIDYNNLKDLTKDLVSGKNEGIIKTYIPSYTDGFRDSFFGKGKKVTELNIPTTGIGSRNKGGKKTRKNKKPKKKTKRKVRRGKRTRRR
jgi:hypothetical protein